MRGVITFHAVDEGPAPLSYPPAGLERLLRIFSEHNVPVLSLENLLRPDCSSGVALTFDDGMASLHDAALPILKAYGAPAHLFLTTSGVGKDNHWPGQPAGASRYEMLSWKQVEALHAGGVRIEGHTATHPDLRPLNVDQIASEMAVADDLIERHVGRRPRYFAYPYGFHGAAAREVASATYDASFTTELAFLGRGPRERLPRLDSHYLRSPVLLSQLGGPAARMYIELRRAIRTLRNRQ